MSHFKRPGFWRLFQVLSSWSKQAKALAFNGSGAGTARKMQIIRNIFPRADSIGSNENGWHG